MKSELEIHRLFLLGNGNPLQCSCLENPRDRGAWWAAIYVVSQSQTQLSSSSSSSSSMGLVASQDLPTSGIESMSPALAGEFFTTSYHLKGGT